MSFRRVWWLPPIPHASVLELGPGDSRAFERHVTELGWSWAGRGSTENPCEYAQWGGPYDAIFAWQVFEHTLDPGVVAQKAHSALKPGGWLVLSVPNVASFEAWWYGERWDGWNGAHPDVDGPHRHWFTPLLIRHVLTQQGFQQIRVLHQRVFKGSRLPRPAELVAASLLAALRMSGRMTVIARRP